MIAAAEIPADKRPEKGRRQGVLPVGRLPAARLVALTIITTASPAPKLELDTTRSSIGHLLHLLRKPSYVARTAKL